MGENAQEQTNNLRRQGRFLAAATVYEQQANEANEDPPLQAIYMARARLCKVHHALFTNEGIKEALHHLSSLTTIEELCAGRSDLHPTLYISPAEEYTFARYWGGNNDSRSYLTVGRFLNHAFNVMRTEVKKNEDLWHAAKAIVALQSSDRPTACGHARAALHSPTSQLAQVVGHFVLGDLETEPATARYYYEQAEISATSQYPQAQAVAGRRLAELDKKAPLV